MWKSKAHRADSVFAFISFGIFAASMLVALLFGAGIYRNIIEKSRAGENERLSLSYIWTKVKTCDTAESVYIEEFSGTPALCLYEEYDGVIYKTAVYHYDGWIYELFSEAGLELLPEDGTPIIETKALDFEQMDNGLIRIRVDSESMFVFPRGAGEFSELDKEGGAI